MAQVVTATFEDGILKPDQPLDLPAQARVRLVVEVLEEATARDAVWEEFEQIMDEMTIDSGGPIPTREELYDRHRY